MIFPSTAHAAIPVEFLMEHPDFMTWLIAAGLAIITFFLHRAVKQMDDNNKQQWMEIKAIKKAQADHTERLLYLEISHRHHTASYGDERVKLGRRRYDPMPQESPPFCPPEDTQ